MSDADDTKRFLRDLNEELGQTATVRAIREALEGEYVAAQIYEGCRDLAPRLTHLRLHEMADELRALDTEQRAIVIDLFADVLDRVAHRLSLPAVQRRSH